MEAGGKIAAIHVDSECEALEAELLIEAIRRRYGYDFSDYAHASLMRRMKLAAQKEGLNSLSALQDRVLHESACLDRLLAVISINVSAMFRDPGFYLAMREHVIPLLRTWPWLRIWNAGCAGGEEVYSMAILLEEEGLYDRCRIYATDFCQGTLDKAQEGIYSSSDIQTYIQNYRMAGGKADFSSYYRSQYDHVIIRKELKRNIVFAQHNLVSDKSFNEFNLILCRNVMIYFNSDLQGRVLDLLHQSLCRFGVLGLGMKETLRHVSAGERFEILADAERIYRRVQ